MFHHLETTPLSHVVCLLLVVWARAPSAESQGGGGGGEMDAGNLDLDSCGGDHAPSCPGNRTLLASGCCPVGPGQTCQLSLGRSCDQQLGLYCYNEMGDVVVDDSRGVCRGFADLHAVMWSETEIDLAWSNFAPPDYQSEYVVLYTVGQYKDDLSQWEMREIGRDPECTLRGLRPDTLYFIKVALWENPRAAILGNTSETIYIRTSAAEFCEMYGMMRLVGEEIQNDCEEVCACQPTGDFLCSPICAEEDLPVVEEGCRLLPSVRCCEYTVMCPVGGEPCVVNNANVSHGSEFLDGCRRCFCHNGEAECQEPEECPEPPRASFSCARPQRKEVPGQCCPEWYCAEEDHEMCEYEGETYGYLDYFSSQHCGLCRCLGSEGVHCAPDCPPVVMVLPDAACPDPHIREDGCCDTLYCHDPSASLDNFLSRMFAQSYSPVTLTLSFEATPETEDVEIPLYNTYEILYANTSEPGVGWQRRLVQPVDVRIQRDQAAVPSIPSPAAPIDALTRDNAIVVDNRAYVTLSGMHPDTTYYVSIRPLDNDVRMYGMPSKVDTALWPQKLAMIVVKTMPLENATFCHFEGRVIRHEELVSENCSRLCVCSFGWISCRSKCDAENVMMAASPTCPVPRREKIGGECCPQWRCYPPAGGCLHHGLVMSYGESVSEGCSVCTCSNTTVTCVSSCSHADHSPRPDCSLVDVERYCCPQWQCPIERHPPYAARTSITLSLDGHCRSSSSSLALDIRAQVLRRAKEVCLANLAPGAPSDQCGDLQANVRCPHSTDVVLERGDEAGPFHRRRRRETREDPTRAVDGTAAITDLGASTEAVIGLDLSGHAQSKDADTIQVTIVLLANFSTESPGNLMVERLQTLSLHLAAELNSTQLQVLDSDGQVMTPTVVSTPSQVSYVCDPGFSFHRGQCVLSEVESRPSATVSTNMSVSEVTHSSAILTWGQLTDRSKHYVTSLTVEHRLEGQVEWVSSKELAPPTTVYMLHPLAPGHAYQVRLVAHTTWPDKTRWVLSRLSLKTLPQPQGLFSNSDIPEITLQEVTPRQDGAFISWELPPETPDAQVQEVELHWKTLQEQHFTNRRTLVGENPAFARLENLKASSGYTAEVVVILKSKLQLQSGPVHFITKDADDAGGSSKLLLVAALSAVTGLVLGALLTLACVLLCVVRRRARGRAGEFVNQTFGTSQDTNTTDQITAATQSKVI